MSLPALYQLKNEYIDLMTKLSEMDLDAQTIADTIEGAGIVESFNEKAVSCVMMTRHFDNQCEAIDLEIKRLQALKKQRTNASEKLSQYLIRNMQDARIESIDHPLMTIKVGNNAESVEVFDERLIPSDCMAWPDPPPQKPDKTKIKAKIKAGEEVPGCRLTRTHRLIVK
jgi:hypothetical protein